MPLVQLVRASDCGSECHGFESHKAPKKKEVEKASFFCALWGEKPGFVTDHLQKYVLPHRHKAGGASPLGVARAACFEQLACVFASCGAMLY